MMEFSCLGYFFKFEMYAKMQPPGKIAAATVIRLEGRHKPIYHALSEYCSTQKHFECIFLLISFLKNSAFYKVAFFSL
uniref:Uncharacterized protein n=1 Tax=Anas zonorhyncha TaxID=75864 RepID=A0A8B9VN47_9AVES